MGSNYLKVAIALGAAIDYLKLIGIDKIHVYEAKLTAYLFQQSEQIPQIGIYWHNLIIWIIYRSY